MKKFSRFHGVLNFLLPLIILGFGCKRSPLNYSADFKITGQHTLNFSDDQKNLISKNVTSFNKSFKVVLNDSVIQNHKSTNVNVRIDNNSELIISAKNDSVRRLYQIKSIITIDTIIYQGAGNPINHLVEGHTEHIITEVINAHDTIKHFASTTFNAKMDGTVQGKKDDLLIGYLIEKHYLVDYIQDILAELKEKKQSLSAH